MGQSHAEPVARRRHVRVEPVLHRRRHVPAEALHRQPDRAALHQAGDPVFDGIFHQGLQQQRGNSAILARFHNVLAESQARAEADLLHFEIAAGQRQFLAQRNAVALAQAEAAAQEIREADAHFAGAGAVHGSQGGDRVQAVEEKVRVDLHA